MVTNVQGLQGVPDNSGPASTRGFLRVVTPEALTTSQNQIDQARANETPTEPVPTGLASYIRERFDTFRNHRSSSQLDARLLTAQRIMKGEYDPAKLAAIKQFRGSEVYARIIATKCRGATALLRDVFLGAERPWEIKPTPDPELPMGARNDAMALITSEIQNLASNGMPVTEQMVIDRGQQLETSIKLAAKKRAALAAKSAQNKIDDMLVEGSFYQALADFIVDLPVFPFAVIKGPVIRVVPDVRWVQGKAQVENVPKMFWNRVSPFDILFDPGISDITDGALIEKLKVSRADLNECMDLPGYDTEAIRQALDDYGRGGLSDWLMSTDASRAVNEGRENPNFNQSHMIDMLEFHGPVQGRLLLEQGFDPKLVPDPLRDVFVQAWLVGRHIIKVQLTPSPRKRAPYYVTSFEKVPGTLIGNGLPDILEDLQDVANAALRALVNNLSIASGPQVTIDVTRLSPLENAAELYPWKRWFVLSDPSQSSAAQAPIQFFQPQSYAGELLGVYQKMSDLADEISAIPRYTTGTDRVGGPGRTASGLSMLMQNASKVLQTVAANIDRDIMDPLLTYLYDMIMMSGDETLIKGDQAIQVRGVAQAMAREVERAQALQFLQITANPIDFGIVGPTGRAAVLRKIAEDLNLPEQIVPDPDVLMAQQQQAAQQAMGPPGMGPPGAPGDEGPGGQGPPPGMGNQPPQGPPGAPSDNNTRLNMKNRSDPRNSGGAPAPMRVG